MRGLLLLLFLTGCAHAAPRVDPSAPLSMQVRTIDGPPRHLGPDESSPLRVVVFWASWCARCQDALEATSRGTVPYVFVSVDADERQVFWTAERWGLDPPWFWDPAATETRALDPKRLPALYLVGPEGEILYRDAGWDATVAVRLTRAIEAWQSRDPGTPSS